MKNISFILLIFTISLTNLFAQNESYITGKNVIVYYVDNVLGEKGYFPCSYSFTDQKTGKNKIKLTQGEHTLEFKFPRKGLDNFVYKAKFKVESNKTYKIDFKNGKDGPPALIDTETNKQVDNFNIKVISLDKPDKKAPYIKHYKGELKSTEQIAILKYDPSFVKEILEKNVHIMVYKIDGVWGPIGFNWMKRYNNMAKAAFDIAVLPGKHKIIYTICGTKWQGEGIEEIEIEVEAGKTYFFTTNREKKKAFIKLYETK